jgi:hypothetical protein
MSDTAFAEEGFLAGECPVDELIDDYEIPPSASRQR